MRHHRRWTGLLALLAVALIAAACGNDTNGSDEATDTAPVTNATSTTFADGEEITLGGDVAIGLEGETATFLPGAGSFAQSGTQIALTIFDPIAQRGADGQIHPFAAETIEPNADATEWTVTLREGLTFHDGTALTAEVMGQIFDEYLAIDGSTLSGDVAQITELRVDDPLTFTYVLGAPNAAFADLLTGPLGWPFSVEACRAAGESCGSQPVGTGPFRFVSWIRDSELVVERNPDYWRTDQAGNQLPYLDRISFRPITDQSSRLQSVQADTTQAGFTFLADFIGQARGADGVESYESIGNQGIATVFNTLSPPLDDPRVRLALQLGADQDLAIEVLGGTGIVPPHTQMYSEESAWYSQDVADAWPDFDPDAARNLVKEYVEDPQRSDGQAPGTPIRFQYQTRPEPTLLSIAQFYQGMWAEIGVEVEVQGVEQAELITNVIGSADQQPPFSGTFQASIFRVGSESDPYTVLRSAFGEPAAVPGNLSNLTSDTIASNIEVLGTNTDFEARWEANEAIQLELAEQIPFIWAGAAASSIYASSDLRNVAGWTIPTVDGGAEIAGTGVSNAVTHWSMVWLDR